MALRQLARGIWRAGSGRPRVAVLGGVHGNERTGVEVLKRLVQGLGVAPAHRDLAEPVGQGRGELTLAIANPDAVELDARFIDVDLNRCFGELLGAGSGSSLEQRRARELADHLCGLDVLLDLHATNKPSEPFARLPGPICGRFLSRCERLFLSELPSRCRTVLWDPEEIIAGGAMTDEFALRESGGSSGGGAYICYESGLASDTGAVPATEDAVYACLERTGVLPRLPRDPAAAHDESFPDEGVSAGQLPSRDWRHFQITEVFSLDERGFEWTNGCGQENFDLVPGGTVYGRRPDGGEELVAPEDSYMVFPKVESLWALGRPLGWLARRIPDPRL